MSRFIDPASKLWQHADRLAELQKDGHTSAPINVEIDLSNRCSLGCEWCHFAYTHTRGPLKGKRKKPGQAVPGGDLMELGLAIDILDQLKQAGVRSVVWTGGGEPTLHPDFDTIIRHAHEIGLEQGIYTHGGHIKQDRADLMSQCLTFVYISLDAADAASYKRDKGVDRFDEVLGATRRLVSAPGDATVGLGFLITKKNYMQAQQMLDIAYDTGAAYAQYRPTILYDMEHPDRHAEDTGWLAEAIYELRRIQSDPKVEVDLDRFADYAEWNGHDYKTCYWSSLQSVITPNGKMWTCVNKREFPSEEIGDLSVESFAHVWLRHSPCQVNETCRLMCRGHLANQALTQIIPRVEHAAFV